MSLLRGHGFKNTYMLKEIVASILKNYRILITREIFSLCHKFLSTEPLKSLKNILNHYFI